MRASHMTEFGAPDVLKAVDIAEPACGPKDVLIKVGGCGVDRHDLAVRSGLMRRKTSSYRQGLADEKRDIEPPLVLGLEVAGEIVEVGSEVRGLSVGDEVATLPRTNHCGACYDCKIGREESCAYVEFLGHDVDGGYAEYVRVQYDSVETFSGLDHRDASLAGACVGTVVRAVRDIGGLRGGETVLITGAGGGLGIHAVQLASAFGARVLAATSTSSKAEAIADAGADEVVAYERDEGFIPRVKELTGGVGVDLVVDTVGTPVFEDCARVLSQYGRYVIAGDVTGGKVELRPALLFLRRMSIHGSYSPGRSHLRTALRLMERGKIRPVISKTLPFEEASLAHRTIEENDPLGRIVLTPERP